MRDTVRYKLIKYGNGELVTALNQMYLDRSVVHLGRCLSHSENCNCHLSRLQRGNSTDGVRSSEQGFIRRETKQECVRNAGRTSPSTLAPFHAMGLGSSGFGCKRSGLRIGRGCSRQAAGQTAETEMAPRKTSSASYSLWLFCCFFRPAACGLYHRKVRCPGLPSASWVLPPHVAAFAGLLSLPPPGESLQTGTSPQEYRSFRRRGFQPQIVLDLGLIEPVQSLISQTKVLFFFGSLVILLRLQ